MTAPVRPARAIVPARPARAIAPARPARAIELVGPAASGKSTLYRALSAQSADITPGVAFGGLGHLRLGLRHAALLLPAWLGSRDRWLSEKELRSLNYVVGWAEGVERGAAGNGLAVFDHGPIFRLARLRAFGPRLVESAAFRRWERDAVQRWAQLLDAVVWLEAPDALLAERIDARAEQHRMKGGEAGETQRFLGRYRAAYAALLAELAAAGAPEPIRVDTSREPPDAIAARLLARLRP
jgi:chloramphenicol 3-O-phosphotransferase